MSLLVDLPISRKEYEDLGESTDPYDWKYMRLGTKFKNKKGEVVEVVLGIDMFAHQWGAGMSVPERGLRRYRPVFQ